MILFCLVFTESIITQQGNELAMENTIETLDSEISEEEGEEDENNMAGVTSTLIIEDTGPGDVHSGLTFFSSFFKLPSPEDISPPPKLV